MMDKMRSVLRRVWLTTKIVLLLVALMALCIWFAEPFGWVWRTASALALGMIWAIVFRLCGAVAVWNRKRETANRASSLLRTGKPHTASLSETDPPCAPHREPRGPHLPPKSARYTWTLTEGGVPVAVEYDRRAVDNWISLGEDHDAIAHKLA